MLPDESAVPGAGTPDPVVDTSELTPDRAGLELAAWCYAAVEGEMPLFLM